VNRMSVGVPLGNCIEILDSWHLIFVSPLFLRRRPLADYSTMSRLPAIHMVIRLVRLTLPKPNTKFRLELGGKFVDPSLGVNSG
jgi:hypothetical protein